MTLHQTKVLLHAATSISVLAYNDTNTVHLCVIPIRRVSVVFVITIYGALHTQNTWLALLDLWMSLRSEAIRFQMEASFLSRSSGKYKSLY